MICPACHTDNRSTAKFCDECGARLTMLGEEQSADRQEQESIDVDSPVQKVEDASSDAVATAHASAETKADQLQEQAGDSECEHSDGCADLPDSDQAAAAQEVEDVDATQEAEEGDEGEEASADEVDLDALRNPDGVALTEEFDFREFDGVSDDPDFSDGSEPAPLRAETLPDPGRPRKKHASSISAAETTEIPVVGAPPEVLVDLGTLPESAWKPSDTLEMPRINVAEEPGNRAFIAPDASSREAKKAEKKRRKEQKKAAREERKNAPVDAKGRPRVRWSTGKKVVVSLLTLALCGGTVAAVTYSMQLWGGKSVPNVEGLSQADAVYLLQSEGFQIVSDEVASDEVEGVVLMSDPSSGSRVPEGSEVMLHVSVSRIIPKVKGMTEEEALEVLKEAGYENIGDSMTEKRDDSEGKVLAISPKAGAKAKSTEKIVLTLSEYYRVPDVVGKDRAQALATIEKEGYNVTVKTRTSKTVEPGKVISTKPAAKKRLKSGSTVTVYVSISREDQLLEAARAYLSIGSTVDLKSASYVITSVDDLKVHGQDQVYFTISGQPFTELLGQTLYLPVSSATGILTFEKDGTDVIGVD